MDPAYEALALAVIIAGAVIFDRKSLKAFSEPQRGSRVSERRGLGKRWRMVRGMNTTSPRLAVETGPSRVRWL
jgi:hypothetical protein